MTMVKESDFAIIADVGIHICFVPFVVSWTLVVCLLRLERSAELGRLG